MKSTIGNQIFRGVFFFPLLFVFIVKNPFIVIVIYLIKTAGLQNYIYLLYNFKVYLNSLSLQLVLVAGLIVKQVI